MNIPHHFWTHFWCGLVAGAGWGFWWAADVFTNRWAVVGLSMAIGLIVGFVAGRWGDPFWRWLLGRGP